MVKELENGTEGTGWIWNECTDLLAATTMFLPYSFQYKWHITTNSVLSARRSFLDIADAFSLWIRKSPLCQQTLNECYTMIYKVRSGEWKSLQQYQMLRSFSIKARTRA